MLPRKGTRRPALARTVRCVHRGVLGATSRTPPGFVSHRDEISISGRLVAVRLPFPDGPHGGRCGACWVIRTRAYDAFTYDQYADIESIAESLSEEWIVGRGHRPLRDHDEVAGWAEMEQRCRERTEALERQGCVRLEDALERGIMRKVRKGSLPDGWRLVARRACEEVGVVTGVLEAHSSRYDPGDDVGWPSARDEWWVSGRAGDAFAMAAGDARGSLEQFGREFAAKLRSLAGPPVT
jgi:hypothetical protein